MYEIYEFYNRNPFLVIGLFVLFLYLLYMMRGTYKAGVAFEKRCKVAGETLEEFAHLVKTNPDAAYLKLLEQESKISDRFEKQTYNAMLRLIGLINLERFKNRVS